MEPYRAVSFSGGKDSTAMLLRMVELGVPFDEILFCDTTVEFPQMYEHIAKVEEYIGQPITRLTAEHSFEYYLLEYEYIRRSGKRKGELAKGYPFPFVNSRWCTEKFKIETIRRHCKAKAAGRPILHFVGIAADEPKRVRDKAYPLVEWGWTEADCLAYCKKHGFNWGGFIGNGGVCRVGAARYRRCTIGGSFAGIFRAFGQSCLTGRAKRNSVLRAVFPLSTLSDVSLWRKNGKDKDGQSRAGNFSMN